MPIVSSACARAGLRPTRQRLALAQLLFDGGDRHVTAEQLHGEALAAAIPVSLATVYNTLHQFTAAGLLREVVVEPGPLLFRHQYRRPPSFLLRSRPACCRIFRATRSRSAHLPPPPAGTEIQPRRCRSSASRRDDRAPPLSLESF